MTRDGDACALRQRSPTVKSRARRPEEWRGTEARTRVAMSKEWGKIFFRGVSCEIIFSRSTIRTQPMGFRVVARDTLKPICAVYENRHEGKIFSLS